MSYDVKYIGMDVHKEAIVILVQVSRFPRVRRLSHSRQMQRTLW
jgi:hypothetical protein